MKAAIVETEKELKEPDKKREAMTQRVKELKHDVMLLAGAHSAHDDPPARTALLKPVKTRELLDKGERVGEVEVYGYTVGIFKNVRTAILSTITTSVPSGEWFKPHIIHATLTRFYDGRYTHYSRAYLTFLENLKFVEHNKVLHSGSKYRWLPRFQDQTLTEEDVKRRIEEERKALQDVMG